MYICSVLHLTRILQVKGSSPVTKILLYLSVILVCSQCLKHFETITWVIILVRKIVC